MSRKPQPLFLERRSYRQRRLIDAARLLPVLGSVLFGLPVLWPSGPEGGLPTSSAILYLFGMWILLVWLSLVIARHLRDDDSDTAGDSPSQPDAGGWR